MSAASLEDLIQRALAEDVGDGDLTTEAIVPAALKATAEIVVQEPGVVFGLEPAFATFRALDPEARMETLIDEGCAIARVPCCVARVRAGARALLTGERTALNFLQRLSGIATVTRRYVDALAGTSVELLDTRKTAPGLRSLDKRAVACGGALNHRAGLYDAVLVKDNHLAVAGGIRTAVERLHAARPGVAIELEVDTLEQLDEAIAAGVDTVLLDNMDPAALREAVRRTVEAERRDGRRPRLEASGGITLESIRSVAESGVDAISVGALTHSVPALDISLEVRFDDPDRT
jgi:nicotinate-nucleotide pyrophosphorylase (carboxylating)